MSCLHGNHEDNCDNCDEEIRQWTMGYESQLKELCALKEERDALKKENAAFKAVHTTWVDAATDLRDAVLHGLDGLHSEQTNTVLNEFDQFLPIAQPAHESIASDAIECVAHPVQNATEPVAWAIFAGNGNMRLWSRKESYMQAQGDELGLPLVPLFEHPATNIAQPVEPARVRVTDIEKQFPGLARALALWGQAPQKDYDKCWNAFVLIEEELEKILNKAIAQPEQTAVKHNFCPRCGKRLGGIDDVHTCSAPAHLNLSKQTVEKLHRFLDASAGDGVISDGVDAADLYIAIFPEQYAESVK